MNLTEKDEPMAVLSIRIPKFQLEWLKVHKELSGNNIPDVIRALIDYYIQLDVSQ